MGSKSKTNPQETVNDKVKVKNPPNEERAKFAFFDAMVVNYPERAEKILARIRREGEDDVEPRCERIDSGLDG